MTTAPPTGPTGSASSPPPAERGRTVLSDRVVTKVAARSAEETLEERFGAPPDPLGLNAPRASATVSGGSARVALTLDLPYPVDIGQAVNDLRDRIGQRIAALTGLTVDDLSLTVRRLVLTGGPGRGRVH